MKEKIDILFDMETADPDDFLTLCFLLGHPKVNLHAITVTPGGKKQVGLVKTVLNRMNIDIPVGARTPDYTKNAVSSYYEKVLGKIPEINADDIGWKVISDTVKKVPNITVITGAPVTNLYESFMNDTIKLKKWVAQGGFAGDNIVPENLRLQKFDGMLTCPTFNFNGNPKGAEFLLNTYRIKKRVLVSKNVCHGVVYTKDLHNKYYNIKDTSECTKLIYKAMDIYLKKHPNGKKLHDPLAACTAINQNICTFKEVKMYRRKGKWGANLDDSTNTWISIGVDEDLFHKTFLYQI